MIFCGKCGTPMQDGLSKCPVCGYERKTNMFESGMEGNSWGQPAGMTGMNGINGMTGMNGRFVNDSEKISARANAYDKDTIDYNKNIIFGMVGMIISVIVGLMMLIPITNQSGDTLTVIKFIKEYFDVFKYLGEMPGSAVIPKLWYLGVSTITMISFLAIIVHTIVYAILQLVNLCTTGNCYRVFINQTKSFGFWFCLQLLFLYTGGVKKGVSFWIYFMILGVMVITLLVGGLFNIVSVAYEDRRNFFFHYAINVMNAVIAFAGLFVIMFDLIKVSRGVGFGVFDSLLCYYAFVAEGTRLSGTGICFGIVAILAITGVIMYARILNHSIENVNRGIYADNSTGIRAIFGLIISIVMMVVIGILSGLQKDVSGVPTGFQIMMMLLYLVLIAIFIGKTCIEMNKSEFGNRLVPYAKDLNEKAVANAAIEIGVVVIGIIIISIMGMLA